MKTMWLWALPVALAAFIPASAGAMGRSPIDAAPVSAEPSAEGYGTYTYADVLKPHGRERGEAAEQSAASLCDAGNRDVIGSPNFNACMSARGWRLAHFEPSAPGTYIYADVVKPHGRDRSDAARQSATNICDGRDQQNIGLPAFDACMLAHGWRFVASVPQQPSYDANAQDSANEEASDDDQRRLNDSIQEQAATDAANAAAQQQFNDGMAAAQQQMNQAVFYTQ